MRTIAVSIVVLVGCGSSGPAGLTAEQETNLQNVAEAVTAIDPPGRVRALAQGASELRLFRAACNQQLHAYAVSAPASQPRAASLAVVECAPRCPTREQFAEVTRNAPASDQAAAFAKLCKDDPFGGKARVAHEYLVARLVVDALAERTRRSGKGWAAVEKMIPALAESLSAAR